jgi:ribulose-5-phosphate 4-epimerase/fuculose-1-phosphate aldolase
MTTATPARRSAPSPAAWPDETEWNLRVELAAVYRLVAHFKMTDLIFSHISLRLPGDEPRFLINPYGLLFEEITASNLVVVGLDGEPVSPGGTGSTPPAS